MAITNNLINKFVEATNDSKNEKQESNLYGTVKIVNGDTFVQIDGSEILTPMPSVTTAKEGDRVKVEIKDHAAVIVGNVSDPSAMSSTVEALDAEIGTFNTLLANKATIEDLAAANANIDNLNAKVVNVESLVAGKAEIEDLTATNVEINNLKVNKADVEVLNAVKGDFEILSTDVAEISNLIFDGASGNVIHSNFADAVVSAIAYAMIQDANIGSISAGKITSGEISTSNVSISSYGGNLMINGETIQIKDINNVVRVQIGKDASNDYSINIWDANGILMFSKGGITDAAIKDAIIRNDMVDANANISASKLDIDSLFTEINDENSTNTIKSTKVYLDDKKQTLKVGFNTLSKTVTDIDDMVTAQGNIIEAVQGEITSKVWQTDITTAIKNLEIGGRNLAVGTSEEWTPCDVSAWSGQLWHTVGGSNNFKHLYSDYGVVPGDSIVFSVDLQAHDKQIAIRVDHARSDGSGTKANIGNYISAGSTGRSTLALPVLDGYDSFWVYIGSDGTVADSIPQYYRKLKIEKGTKATDWTPAPEDVEGEISTRYTEVKQDVESLSTVVASYKSDVDSVANQMISLEQNLNGFKTTVSNTYTTKTDFDNLSIGGRNLLPRSGKIYAFGCAAGLSASRPGDEYFQVIASSGNSNWVNMYLGTTANVENEFIEGDPFTISFTMRSPSNLNGNLPTIYLKSGMGYYQLKGKLTSEWSTVWYTGTWKDANSLSFHLGFSDCVGTYEFLNCKLEKGNKPTAWTPAPEDVDAEIELRATKTEVNQLSDRITSTVTDVDALGTRMSTVEQKADGLTVSLNNIGGRNLIQTAYLQFDGFYPSSTKEYVINGIWARQLMSTTNTLKMLEPSTEYTINCVFECTSKASGTTLAENRLGFALYSHSANSYIGLTPSNISDTINVGDKITFKRTFKTPATIPTDTHFMGYTRRWTNPESYDGFKVYNLKLEKGNKATDWTPAPEDVANAQSTANSAQSTANTANSTANTANTTANSVRDDLANNYTKKTLSDTRNDNQNPGWYISNYPKQIITEFKFSNVIGLSGETFCVLTTTVPWKDPSGGYPKQMAKVGSKEYWRVGTSDTAWSTWNDPGATATNYLNFSTNGLVVGDMTASTLGNNVLIDNDSVDIRNGTTVLASYKADSVELGKNSRSAVIDLCAGTAQIKNINDDPSYEWNRLGIVSGEGGGGSVEITANQFSAGTYFEGETNNWGSTYISTSSYSPWLGGGDTHAAISMHTDRKTPLGLRATNMVDMDSGIIRMISDYKEFESDDTKFAGVMIGKQDDYGHAGQYGVGISTVNIAGNFNYAFFADEAASYIGLPGSGTLYIPYYQSGDGIDYSGSSTKTFYTSGFVTNSGKDVYFTIPLSKPAVVVSTIYAESSYGFQLRQNGNYTHGSGASAWAKPSSYECHLAGGGNAITVIAKFTTTTNVVNNAPVGIRWSGVIGFDIAG